MAFRPAALVSPRTAPEEASAALTQAMTRENVPDSWRKGLEFIMQKESPLRRCADGLLRSACLSLFGSVLKGPPTPDSDVDLLVEFVHELQHILVRFAEIEAELSA